PETRALRFDFALWIPPSSDPSPGPRRLVKTPSRPTLSTRERADFPTSAWWRPFSASLLRPWRGFPVPAVRPQLRQKLSRKRPRVAGCGIGFHVLDLAHSGNNCADRGVREDEAQSQLGHRHTAWNQGPERFGARHAGLQILRHKVGVAPIVFR